MSVSSDDARAQSPAQPTVFESVKTNAETLAVPETAPMPAPGSWEEIANEIVPLNAPASNASRGLAPRLATGARRGKNPRYPAHDDEPSRPAEFARPSRMRVVPVPPARADLAFEEALPGRVVATATSGEFYLFPRAASDVHPSFSNIPARLECALKTERFPTLSNTSMDELLFIDIETMGLSEERPLFLIGVLDFDGGLDGCMEQFLARTPDEEGALLANFARRARDRTIVTFNGRAFDWPFIKRRAQHHGIKVGAPRFHFDLLQHARRVWRSRVPNCRLQTLETYLCGRERRDDVPSADVPREYERFVAEWRETGRGADVLAPVLHHNALDVLTMAELLCLACDGGRR